MLLSEVIDVEKVKSISEVKTVGIDVGSRSAKGVLLADGQLHTVIIPTGYDVEKTASDVLDKLLEESGYELNDIQYIVGTGYGRVSMHFDVPTELVTEISCHGLGAYYLGDNIKTILDIGGQDSKAIKIDPENGQVLNFVMNDKCAAGTGRFLEKMANILGYDAEQIGEVSLSSKNPVPISSQCVVFAESEVISERAKGVEVDDLAMGIYLSVARRVNNLLSRVGIEEGVIFTGGVSNNVGMRIALEKIMNIKIQTARLDTVFAGALGAAIHAQRYYSKQLSSGELAKRKNRLYLDPFKRTLESRKAAYISRSTGKSKYVAYMCTYTPIEILAAADVAHIRLYHTGTATEISSGEHMTQSVFCDLTKSIIGKFYEKDPMYQAIDKIYMFYTCDCMKKTAEAISRNFVPTEIYNLPRIRDRENSLEYYRRELAAFKKNLEELTGKEIKDEDIRKQIKLYNRVRELYRNISAYRKLPVPPINSQEYQYLVSGYYYIPAEELIPLLEDVEAQLKKASKEPAEGRVTRILIAGGALAEGDTTATRIIENNLGAYVVAEDNCTGYKLFIDDVPDNEGDVLEAIAEGYLRRAPCIRMKPLMENEDLAVEIANEYDVDGVVFYYLKFCPGYSIAKNQFSQRFKEEGFPILEVPNDYSSNDEGQLLTRLEAFVEVLDERRKAGVRVH